MKPDDAALWMPFYVGDWLADTGHLDGPEQGAYFLLVLHYWRTRAPLKDDDARLARIARTAPEAWEAMRGTIAELFVVSGGVWRHKRVDKELEASKIRRSKALHANEVRWGKEGSTSEDSSEHPRGSSEESSEESRGLQAQHNNNTTQQQHSRKKQGKKPRTAKSAVLAAVGREKPAENGHARTPQQAQVQAVFDVFERFGAKPPPGGRAAAWLAKYDGARLLRELAAMGAFKLRKGPDFVTKVLGSVFGEPEGLEGSEEELRARAFAAIDRYEQAGGDRMTAGNWRLATQQVRGSPELRKYLRRFLAEADAAQREQDQREPDNGRQDANPE